MKLNSVKALRPCDVLVGGYCVCVALDSELLGRDMPRFRTRPGLHRTKVGTVRLRQPVPARRDTGLSGRPASL